MAVVKLSRGCLRSSSRLTFSLIYRNDRSRSLSNGWDPHGLSERLGPENVAVLVFDAHTDAVPLPIRSGLVQYASEAGLPSPDPSPYPRFSPYTTGDFLLHLIEEEIILPVNLIIVGTADRTEELRSLNDRRVREYVRHFDLLLDRGVKIIGNSNFNNWELSG